MSSSDRSESKEVLAHHTRKRLDKVESIKIRSQYFRSRVSVEF